MINDTLRIDLVCLGQIAVCLRSPQCHVHHRRAQCPVGISCWRHASNLKASGRSFPGGSEQDCLHLGIFALLLS